METGVIASEGDAVNNSLLQHSEALFSDIGSFQTTVAVNAHYFRWVMQGGVRKGDQ